MNSVIEQINSILFSFQSISGLFAMTGMGLSFHWHRKISLIDKRFAKIFLLSLYWATFCSGISIALGKWGMFSLPLVVIIYSYLFFSNKEKLKWKTVQYVSFISSMIFTSILMFLLMGTMMFKLAVDY